MLGPFALPFRRFSILVQTSYTDSCTQPPLGTDKGGLFCLQSQRDDLRPSVSCISATPYVWRVCVCARARVCVCVTVCA